MWSGTTSPLANNPDFCKKAVRESGRPQFVKKDFDKLVDGGASSPARCRVSNLRFEPSAVSPSAKPENPLGFQPSCHPYQFLLKSFRFPGAKTARKFERALALSSSPRVFRQSEAVRESGRPLLYDEKSVVDRRKIHNDMLWRSAEYFVTNAYHLVAHTSSYRETGNRTL